MPQFAEATVSFVSMVFVVLMYISSSWYFTKLCHVAIAVFLFENVSNIKTISRSCIYFPSTIAKYTQSNFWFKILI